MYCFLLQNRYSRANNTLHIFKYTYASNLVSNNLNIHVDVNTCTAYDLQLILEISVKSVHLCTVYALACWIDVINFLRVSYTFIAKTLFLDLRSAALVDAQRATTQLAH